MKKFEISKNRRVKITPYTSRLESYGVGGYTVYNHMLLPTYFKSLEDEYFHLKKDVQLWDVSVQKQIEVSGSDSNKLVQLMTCRDLSGAKVLKCYYVPLIDGNGNMINDPLVLKVEDMKWRICIADSDVLLYAKGVAGGSRQATGQYVTGSGSGGGSVIVCYKGTLTNNGTINVDGGILSAADNGGNTTYPSPQGGAGSYQLINVG